jgi:hypothetical protein
MDPPAAEGLELASQHCEETGNRLFLYSKGERMEKEVQCAFACCRYAGPMAEGAEGR